eukprot:268440-Prorocentrum_minimum.AAC.1
MASFFALSKSQLPSYYLPGGPGLALLAAAALARPPVGPAMAAVALATAAAYAALGAPRGR